MSEGTRIEFEQTKIDANVEAELFELAVQWVAITLIAGLDPNRHNPILTDIARALDRLAMSFDLTRSIAGAVDRLGADVLRALQDSSASGDELTAHAEKLLADAQAVADSLDIEMGWTDISRKADLIRADMQRDQVDVSGVLDLLLGSLVSPLSDVEQVLDHLLFGFPQSSNEEGDDALSQSVDRTHTDVDDALDQLTGSAVLPNADTAQSDDPGTAYIQDYAEDYVEAEYVGDKFTF